MFAQHNNDSNLVIDSRGSLDSCKRLFWLNRSSVLGMVEAISAIKLVNFVLKCYIVNQCGPIGELLNLYFECQTEQFGQIL